MALIRSTMGFAGLHTRMALSAYDNNDDALVEHH
jgi:hypothetical protein